MLAFVKEGRLIRDEKLKRLEYVARQYYEQNMTQADIAEELGVSRPLISRMLDEARQAGIVEIRIRPRESSTVLGDEFKERYALRGGCSVPEGADDEATNQLLGQAAIALTRQLGGGHLGLGWGHIIGTIVSIFEKQAPAKTTITDVCPMIGNSGVPIRNYHSNENARIVSQQAMAQAHYLYTPAVADTKQDLDLLLQTEPYKAVLREWERLDIALVNIGDHPSTPDLGSGARFGNLLAKRRAVGKLIAYYFDIEGDIIRSDRDYVIQIPLEVLQRCPNIVGVCSANTSPRALLGGLRTGLFTHIVAREGVLGNLPL